MRETKGKIGPFEVDITSIADLNSLEVSKTAKGDYTYTFKVYFHLIDIEKVKKLQEEVRDWFKKFREEGE